MKKCKLNNYVLKVLFALSVCVSLTEAQTITYGICQSTDNHFNFYWCYNNHENPKLLYTEKFGPLSSDLFTLMDDNIVTLFIPHTDGKLAHVPDDSFSIEYNVATNQWIFKTKKGIIKNGECKIIVHAAESHKTCTEMLKASEGG